MKKYILILAAILFAAISVQAQPRSGRHHRGPDPKMFKEITDFKIKFLAKEMGLTGETKERFAKVYGEMSEQKRRLFDEIRDAERKLRNTSEPSDKDYEATSRKISDVKLRDAQIEKEYDEKFATFLTPKQMYQMKQGEEKFRRRCVEMHHKRKQNAKFPKPQKTPKANKSN